VHSAITERSAVSLARAIRTGELTAAEVVEEHIARHQRFGPRINAIAADRFAAAREEASAADERIAISSSDAELPPLLGVPCTIKESIAVRGMPLSGGLVARRDYRSPDNATAVQRLIDAGAIVLGVTNVS
jgi:fatty acid amide hydrolase 2